MLFPQTKNKSGKSVGYLISTAYICKLHVMVRRAEIFMTFVNYKQFSGPYNKRPAGNINH